MDDAQLWGIWNTGKYQVHTCRSQMTLQTHRKSVLLNPQLKMDTIFSQFPKMKSISDLLGSSFNLLLKS